MTSTMPAKHPISGLSPRGERLLRRLSTLTVVLLSMAAAVVSFAGLQNIALRSGFSPELAWLIPVIIDGLVVTGSLGVIAASLVGIPTWYPWMLTVLGVSTSIAGNVAAAPPDLVAQMLHATGPATFALSIEGLLRIYRASAVASVDREAREAAREEASAARAERARERELRAAERLAALAPVTPVGSAAPASPVSAASDRADEDRTPARERVQALLAAQPAISGGEVARTLGIDPSYARKLVRELRDGNDAAPTASQVPLTSSHPVDPLSSDTDTATDTDTGQQV